MPEPLPKFFPGDPATKALNAGFLNALVNRIDLTPRRPKPNKKRDPVVSTVECLVVNNTSGAFPERSVVACTSKGLNLSTDDEKLSFQSEPVLQIDVPAASTDFPIICLEPIPANGGVGRAAIGGIAVCTINVTDAGHEYANPTPTDETRLTSAATGQARILWKDTGTGNKTAVVYLVESAGGGSACEDETLCDGAWHTADYVTDVTLDCTAGTLTLDVTTDGSRDYWTRTTPP